jgi:hypothetical protein
VVVDDRSRAPRVRARLRRPRRLDHLDSRGPRRSRLAGEIVETRTPARVEARTGASDETGAPVTRTRTPLRTQPATNLEPLIEVTFRSLLRARSIDAHVRHVAGPRAGLPPMLAQRLERRDRLVHVTVPAPV